MLCKRQETRDKISQENAEQVENCGDCGAGNRVQNVVLLLLLAKRIFVSPKRTCFTFAAHNRQILLILFVEACCVSVVDCNVAIILTPLTKSQ